MIVNNLKHSIWSLIFSIISLIVFSIGLFVIIESRKVILIIFYGLFVIGSIFLFYIALKNIQWIRIENDRVVARNIFGTIKIIKYLDIKKAFVINATIFSIKMMHITKLYIVLSVNKSLQKSKIEDAYNRKKNKYIIIPYNDNSELLIKKRYKECIDSDLSF